jgi:hypothetical protein
MLCSLGREFRGARKPCSARLHIGKLFKVQLHACGPTLLAATLARLPYLRGSLAGLCRDCAVGDLQRRAASERSAAGRQVGRLAPQALQCYLDMRSLPAAPTPCCAHSLRRPLPAALTPCSVGMPGGPGACQAWHMSACRMVHLLFSRAAPERVPAEHAVLYHAAPGCLRSALPRCASSSWNAWRPGPAGGPLPCRRVMMSHAVSHHVASVIGPLCRACLGLEKWPGSRVGPVLSRYRVGPMLCRGRPISPQTCTPICQKWRR